MGTRADFYVGRKLDSMVWFGSIGQDGYPDDGSPVPLLKATTEDEYVRLLQTHLASLKDWTDASDGWPWPWKTSATTDYSYSFDDGCVWISRFGREWIRADEFPAMTEEQHEIMYEHGKKAEFPDMTLITNVQLGKKSGLMILMGEKK